MILVRFRHLNGNLKLAGSGDGIDWGVSWWHTTLAVSGRWVDLQGCVMGSPDWIGVIESICGGVPRGGRSLAGSGRWDWIVGICDNGWIGAMELFYGDMRHWLEQGNGVDLWRCGALAGTGWWDWFRGLAIGAHDTGWIRVMGLIYGGVPWGMQHGLDRGDGIDLWDTSWGHTTGSGRWDWFEGAILAECELWDWFIGVFHGGRNWIGAMELICGGEPWGRMTLARSGWGDWFMWVRHEGVRHWLDWGYGIDPWARVEWQSAIWLLNVNDKVLYGCWM